MTGLVSLIVEGLFVCLIATFALLAYLADRARVRRAACQSLRTTAFGGTYPNFDSLGSSSRWDRFALSVSLHFVCLAALQGYLEHYPGPALLAIDDYDVVTVENRTPLQTTTEVPWPRKVVTESPAESALSTASGKASGPPAADPTAARQPGASPPAKRPESGADPETARIGELQAGNGGAAVLESLTDSERSPIEDVVLRPDFTLPLIAPEVPKAPPVLVWAQNPARTLDHLVVEPVPEVRPVTEWRLPLGAPARQTKPREALANLGVEPAPDLEGPESLSLPRADISALAVATPPPAMPPTLSGGQGEQALLVLPRAPELPTETFTIPKVLYLGSSTPRGALDDGAGDTKPAMEPGGGAGTDDGAPSPYTDSAVIAGETGYGRVPGAARRTPDAIVSQDSLGSEGMESGKVDPSVSPDIPFGPREDRGPKDQPLRPVPRKQHGIILVSSSLVTVPEAQGLLTGNPIYTVYMKVGKNPKKWALQFCVKGSSPNQLQFQDDGVIRIVPRKDVSPPYPVYMEGPESVSTDRPPAQRSSRVIVFFTLNERGEMTEPHLIRGNASEWGQRVLAILRTWRFLPAFEGDEPVAVEVLMTIPHA